MLQKAKLGKIDNIAEELRINNRWINQREGRGSKCLRSIKTVREVVGPLMIVEGVEGVKYDELGEVELQNGEKRRGKVLEVNGSKAMVQLFEGSTGINKKGTKAKFLERP